MRGEEDILNTVTSVVKFSTRKGGNLMQGKKNIRLVVMFIAFVMAMSLLTANVFAEDASVDYWTVDLPDSTLVVFDITASSVEAMNATLTSLENAITALDAAIVAFAGPSPYDTPVGQRKPGGDPGNGEAMLRAALVAAIPELEDDFGNIRPYVFAWTRAAFINPDTLGATNGGLAAGDVVQLRQLGAAGVGTVTQTTFRTNQSTHPMIRLMAQLQTIYTGASTPERDALVTIVNNIPDLVDGSNNIRPFVLTWTRAAFINPDTLGATNGGFAAGDVVQIRQMGAAGVGTITQATFRTNQSNHPMIQLMEALRVLPKS